MQIFAEVRPISYCVNDLPLWSLTYDCFGTGPMTGGVILKCQPHSCNAMHIMHAAQSFTQGMQ